MIHALATAPIGFGLLDLTFRYVWLNAALARMSGRSINECLGQYLELSLPNLHLDFQSVLDHVLITQSPIEQIAVGRSATGLQRLMTLYPVFAPDASIEQIGVIILELEPLEQNTHDLLIEVINQKTLELSQIQTQQLEAIFQNASVGLAVYDVSPDFRCLQHNQPFLNLMGSSIRSKETMIGIPLVDLVMPQYFEDVYAICLNVAKTGEIFSTDEYLAHMVSDPQPRWYSWNISPLRDSYGMICALLVTASEITAQKQALEERHVFERKLLEAQKLESLGVLAGTIAHDFNNILAVVLGNIELAIHDLEFNDRSILMNYLMTIETATQRATDLARQILAYSGRGNFIIQMTNINDLIQEMIELIKVSINKQIILDCVLDLTIREINIDPTQIRQIIMNLIINAADAIGHNKGTITVRTGYQKIDELYIQLKHPDIMIESDLYIFIEISDTGIGISEANISKIFDPFFTTKSTGRGLGLAAVQGIVRAHKGFMNLYSTPGLGTTFTIFLPCLPLIDQPSSVFLEVGDLRQTSSTILVVDDEVDVRETIGKMLEKLHFTVVFASNGLEALRILKQTPTIQIVLLDLTMPGLDGYEILYLLYQYDSQIPVILMSGYTLNNSINLDENKNLAGILRKPFSFVDLRNIFAKIIP